MRRRRRRSSGDHSSGRNPFEPLDAPIASTLDLHGYTAAEANSAAVAFLKREAKRTPGALVHIITGKGRGSTGDAVLKTRIRSLLRQPGLPVAHWGEDLDGGGFLVRLRA